MAQRIQATVTHHLRLDDAVRTWIALIFIIYNIYSTLWSAGMQDRMLRLHRMCLSVLVSLQYETPSNCEQHVEAGGGGENKSSLSHREGERENMDSQLLAENKRKKVLKFYNRETGKQGSVWASGFQRGFVLGLVRLLLWHLHPTSLGIRSQLTLCCNLSSESQKM